MMAGHNTETMCDTKGWTACLFDQGLRVLVELLYATKNQK